MRGGAREYSHNVASRGLESKWNRNVPAQLSLPSIDVVIVPIQFKIRKDKSEHAQIRDIPKQARLVSTKSRALPVSCYNRDRRIDFPLLLNIDLECCSAQPISRTLGLIPPQQTLAEHITMER
ncbi:hypothetical protein RRG08_029979 [Elysia crispata]|uniref:Uncharacterized protein n=1 Tax=Elysia crispata TaxID=231223 RepID=A0AAE1DH31_9GAST|nr:hypothetical protein RRG08_029979 [Elysia crispata]